MNVLSASAPCPQYDHQHRVNSKSTKPCFHSPGQVFSRPSFLSSDALIGIISAMELNWVLWDCEGKLTPIVVARTFNRIRPPAGTSQMPALIREVQSPTTISSFTLIGRVNFPQSDNTRSTCELPLASPSLSHTPHNPIWWFGCIYPKQWVETPFSKGRLKLNLKIRER